MKNKIEEKTTNINGYILVNPEKVDRVVNGTIGQGGKLIGGLGKEAEPELVLAHYDKTAGLIRTKNGEKVATGSFWDFENKKPRTEPQITLAGKANPTGKIQIKEVKMGDEDKGDKPKRRKQKTE